jgi:hypothetical protein
MALASMKHCVLRFFKYGLFNTSKAYWNCPQEVAQSAGTTPNEAEVISSNPSPSSCVDMSKKKKKKKILLE